MDLVEQLNRVFYPRTIAVVGASDNPHKIGHSLIKGLLDAGFKGKIYPVNPGLSEIYGLTTYPSVETIPGEVDLATIAIPAELTLPVIKECAAKGIKAVIMITSGFKELGTEMGLDLQDRIKDIANKAGMKIVGPNCLGVLNPEINLNTTFIPWLGSTKAGSVAVASQSGGLCEYIAKALTDNNVGVSKLISMGNRCNLYFDEIVEYFAEDEKTKVIVLYVEGLERPRRFIDVARQVVKRKPIVVYKVGRGEETNRASLSHTGTLSGSYQVYKAAFSQAGVIAVDNMTELIDVAKALAFQPPPASNGVAVLSITAGLGIVLADKCCEQGLRLAELSIATKQRLKQLISPLNSVDNPVNVDGEKARDYDVCREILGVVMENDGVDMLVMGFTLSNFNTELIKALLDTFSYYRKPIAYVCIGAMGGDELEENNIPVYPLPERAITALAALDKYRRILKAVG